MCDYSLYGIPNRLAVKGEDLVTYRFPTGSVGMASAEEIASRFRYAEEYKVARKGPWEALKQWISRGNPDPARAVCIPPGTAMRMSRIPDELKRQLGLNPVEDVTFTQLTAEAFQYRDAIRFRNGRHLLLQALTEGVLFQVLSEVSGDSSLLRQETEHRGNSSSSVQPQVR